MKLYDYQLDAIKRMKTGCILNGGTGSGKSLTSIAYYYLQNGGDPDFLEGGEYMPMDDPPKDLYIITTALKRDTKEWEGELLPFLLHSSENEKISLYSNKVVIDSWNNIGKYVSVKNSFFIFDEQRVVGSGAWVKAFKKIAKVNEWILLSATPGDTWSDYLPVFMANGFYKTKREFTEQHVIYNPNTPFPKIDRYINTGKLIRYRNQILIDMDYKRKTTPHHIDITAQYDKDTYKKALKTRTNPFVYGYIPCRFDDPRAKVIGEDITLNEVRMNVLQGWSYIPKNGDTVKNENLPLKSGGELCYLLREIVNSDISRGQIVLDILKNHPKVIIFYSYDYELKILKNLNYGNNVEVAEWNGHKHQPLPASDNWVYLVQYAAGCEGWNCITTDTIIFFSLNYSYKNLKQACGRIDRLNTPFKDLYYYHIKSVSPIDIAIARTLKQKKNFNELKFIKW